MVSCELCYFFSNCELGKSGDQKKDCFPGAKKDKFLKNGMLAWFFQVQEERERSNRLHPRPYASYHEAYALLLEEIEELWIEIKKKEDVRNHGKIHKEACHVANVATKIMEMAEESKYK